MGKQYRLMKDVMLITNIYEPYVSKSRHQKGGSSRYLHRQALSACCKDDVSTRKV